MHNRKIFIVYPPEYDVLSGPRHQAFKSLGKAKKCAFKLGVGSSISCHIESHPAKFTRWNKSSFIPILEVV